MRILIAEDNVAMRRLIRAAVADDRDEVVECADGRSAVRLAEAFQPDVVLMDVEMKELDGITATRSIAGRLPAVRIVIVTQHTHPRIRDMALGAGASAFITKDDLSGLTAIARGDQ